MTKKVPKRPPSPAKTEVLHKKIVYFYSKIPPSLAKNRSFAYKNDKKVPKKVPKRPPSPPKTEVLHEKNVFFTQKNHPASQKTQVVH